MASAASGTVSLTPPSFTNLTTDKHVIVWNQMCTNATSTGNGVLAVDSVEMARTTSTEGGTFDEGGKDIFHITVPTNEPNLAMKFADWTNTSASGTMAVANNIRIPSPKANTSGTVMITAANTYSSPELVLTGDNNSGAAGRQVDVIVEVKIPSGTVNGSYTTTYGVRTLP